MFLKAPGILIFAASVILALVVLYARYFGSDVPFLTGEASQFYAMFAAYVILARMHHARALSNRRTEFRDTLPARSDPV